MTRRARASSLLTLNGWVAFNVPRLVTALGVTLLFALVVLHSYVVTTAAALPAYFLGYTAVLTLTCLLAAFGTTFGWNVETTERAWNLGSLICLAFLAIYLVTRVVPLPGLIMLTGRWDVAPGTLAMAAAAGFVGVHVTVLSGINAAYPHTQHWQD